MGGGYARGDGVGVVGYVDRRGDAAGIEFPGQVMGELHSLDLGQVRRIFDNAVANDAGYRDADGVQRAGIGFCQESDLGGQNMDQLGWREGGKCVRLGGVGGIAQRLCGDAMILKAAGHDVIGHHDADCCGHEKALRAFLASSF